MSLNRNWIVISGVALCYSLTGCEGGKEEFKTAAQVKQERPDAGKKKGGHDHDHDHDHGHHHHAPHHGSLTMVGDHTAQIELTVDAEKGELTAYILDGEAEKPLELDQADLEAVVTPDGATEALTVKLAPADAAKQSDGFVGSNEKLKGVTKLKGTLTSLKLKGKEKAEEKVAVEFDAKKAEEEAEESHKHGHDEHGHDEKDHKHDDHKEGDHKHSDEKDDHKDEANAK